jgi:phosphatidylglycerophosphate synthase
MNESRRPLKTRNAGWAKALARWLVRLRVSPNAISVAGAIIALLGGIALYFAGCNCGSTLRRLLLFAGAAAVQLRLLCNMLDGMVAVEGGLKGRAGDLFNEAPDRVEDVALLVGAGFAVDKPWLGWTAATAAVLTAHVRALGASLGKGQDFCGPLAKPHRMFVLTVGCLGQIVWLGVLQGALWVIACGALFTAGRRLVRLYQKLN